MTRSQLLRSAGVVALALAFGICAACGAFAGASDASGADAAVADGDAAREADALAEAAATDGSDGALGDGGADADAPEPCTEQDPFAKITMLDGFDDVTSVRVAPDGVTAFMSFAVSAANEDIDEGPFPKGALNYFHAVVAPDFDTHPAPVKDPLVLYYEHGAAGARGVARATRAQVGQAFSAPTLNVLGVLGAESREPYALGDGSVVYFTRQPTTTSSRDIYRATLSGGVWTTAHVGGLSPAFDEGHPVVSEDELMIFYSRVVSVGQPAEIWAATRDDKLAAFNAGLPVTELQGKLDAGTNSDDRPTWLSPDRCTLLFVSNRSGSYRPYSASRR